MTKVAIICTSHDKLGDTGDSTGCWAEEVMAPYFAFQAAGYEVTVASIKGGEVPMDESSLNPPFVTKDVEKFLLDGVAMKQVEESTPLSAIKAADFDAFFLAGGHGTCWDFGGAELASLLSSAFQAGKVVSAVCHGPHGLVNVKDKDGVSIIKGRKVTGFTNDEEYAVAKEKIVPVMLEDQLKSLGGLYEHGDKWAVHAVRDGLLVTGQNPGSSLKTAELVVEALTASKAA